VIIKAIIINIVSGVGSQKLGTVSSINRSKWDLWFEICFILLAINELNSCPNLSKSNQLDDKSQWVIVYTFSDGHGELFFIRFCQFMGS